MSLASKLLLYLDRKILLYIVRHPFRAFRVLRSVMAKADYLGFCSEIIGSSVQEVRKLMPSKETRALLVKAFKDSINPASGEMPISFEEAMSLYCVIRALRPSVVIETGVSAGRSTSFILAALRDNGHGVLYSIDPDPKCGYAVPRELIPRWRFYLGTSEEVLPRILKEIGAVDIFLHDSLHTYENMLFEYRAVWPYIKRGGLLLSDDVDFNNAFRDFLVEKAIPRHCIAFLTKSFAGVRKCV